MASKFFHDGDKLIIESPTGRYEEELDPYKGEWHVFPFEDIAEQMFKIAKLCKSNENTMYEVEQCFKKISEIAESERENLETQRIWNYEAKEMHEQELEADYFGWLNGDKEYRLYDETPECVLNSNKNC